MQKSRRIFIKNSALAAGGIGCGALALGSCASFTHFTYADYTIEKDRVVVSQSAFGTGNHVIIKMPNLKKPVYIGKLEDGGYSALLMECTHKKCTVRPVGNTLQCPCHGSEFSNSGQVLESPADRALKVFSVSHDDSNIYIY